MDSQGNSDSSIFICFASYGLWSVSIVVVSRGWINPTLVNQTCGLFNLFLITLPNSCISEGEYTRHQQCYPSGGQGTNCWQKHPIQGQKDLPTKPLHPRTKDMPSKPPHLMTRGQKLPKAPHPRTNHHMEEKPPYPKKKKTIGHQKHHV